MNSVKILRFATRSAGKIASMNRALSDLQIEVIADTFDYPELQVDDVSQVARHKARSAFVRKNGSSGVIALDAGLSIPALKDFPGAYTKYVLEKIGVGGMLRLVPKGDRDCELRHAICYAERNEDSPCVPQIFEFSTSVYGILAKKARGKLQPWHWSEISRIFVPFGEQKTLAEMSEEEYRAFGARFSPSRKLADWFRAYPEHLARLGHL